MDLKFTDEQHMLRANAMDLKFTDEQHMLRATTQALCRDASGVDVVRQMENDPLGVPEPLWGRRAYSLSPSAAARRIGSRV